MICLRGVTYIVPINNLSLLYLYSVTLLGIGKRKFVTNVLSLNYFLIYQNVQRFPYMGISFVPTDVSAWAL